MNKDFKMKSVLAILVSIISVQSCNTPQEEIKIIGPAKNKTRIEMVNTMGNFIPTASPSIRPISIDTVTTPSPVITAKPPTILTTPKPYISIIPSTEPKAVSKLYTIPLSIDSGKVNAYLTPSSETSGRFLVNFQDISDIPSKIQLLDQFGNNIIKSNNFNVSMAGNFVITYVKQADQKISKLQLFFVSGKMIEKIIDESLVSNGSEPTPIPPNPTPVPTPTIATNYPVTYIPTGAKVTTLAGSIAGYADGTGANAKFSFPAGITVDSSNNLYVIDFDPNSTSFIRKITPDGTVSTIAGSTVGFADGVGSSAQFANPFGITVDNNGNIYVSDTNNNRIRKITPDGTVTTIAGSTQGYSDGVGTAAQFYNPFGITVDNNGNLFVADSGNYKIRKITPDGTVTTIAGSTQGYSDGVGTAAQFETPAGLDIDNNTGNIFVADTLNKKIRKITPDGTVTTIAGSTVGFTDGVGTSAKFYNPYSVAVDNKGNVFVTDTFNNKIRKIDTSNNVTTIAGSTIGFADGFGLDSKFYFPIELAVDNSGKIYVSDSFNRKIRKISPN